MDAVGLAYPVAPLDELLLRLPPGAVFDAVVQARTAAGRYRLSVAGMTVELETALEFAPKERVRLTVKSSAPLVLELGPAPRGAPGSAAEEASARPLPAPEVEAAVRAFVAARPEQPGREAAARFLAVRGLGFDPRVAAGLASLAAEPRGAGPLLERAVRGLEAVPAAAAAARAIRTLPPAAPPAPGPVEALVRFLAGETVLTLEQAARAVLGAAGEALAADPGLAALDRRIAAAGESGDAAATEAEAAALRRHPLAEALRPALEAAAELADRGLAVRVLNGEAAVRGEGAQLLEFVTVRDGRFESVFARVERRTRGRAEAPGTDGVVLTVAMSRLGAVRAALDVAGAAAAVALTASSPRARRALERARRGLAEALLRLGLRAEVRVNEGPVDPLSLTAPGLDLRA